LESLLDYTLGGLGVFFEEDGELLVHRSLHRTPDLRIPQLGLGLPLELRLHDLHAENAGETFPHIVSGEALLGFLEEVVLPAVIVDGPCEGRFQPGEVGPTFMGVDVVHEGVGVLAEAIVILHGQLDLGLLPTRFEIDDLRVQRLTTSPEELHKGGQSALVVVFLDSGFLLTIEAFVGEGDAEPLVQERQFTKTVGEGAVVELQLSENRRVGDEVDLGTLLLGLPQDRELSLFDPPSILLVVDLPISGDLNLQRLGKGVHDADTYPVQSA